jgi:hypothetical protein
MPKIWSRPQLGDYSSGVRETWSGKLSRGSQVRVLPGLLKPKSMRLLASDSLERLSSSVRLDTIDLLRSARIVAAIAQLVRGKNQIECVISIAQLLRIKL